MSRVVYGAHPVEEALRRRRGELQGIVVARRGELPPAIAEAQSRGVPVQRASAEELDLLCGASSHQGLAAIVGDYPYLDLEDLLAVAGAADPAAAAPLGSEGRGRSAADPAAAAPLGSEGRGRSAADPAAAAPLLLILDSITDPQNLGAIIRSAAFLGATGLVLPKDRAAPITPVVVRVSAGASEHLRCARVTNLARALEQIKEAGIWVVGAVEQGGVAPEQIELAGPTALVLGNEQKGIRPLVLRGCDIVCTIPSPRSSIGSLNVAAAATALLHEASRQRRAS